MTLAAGLIAASPVLAQDETPPSDEFRQGAEKLGEALELFMDGFSNEMEPLAKAWRDLIEDIPKYQTPEELPNGDIIIRRKDATGTDI